MNDKEAISVVCCKNIILTNNYDYDEKTIFTYFVLHICV